MNSSILNNGDSSYAFFAARWGQQAKLQQSLRDFLEDPELPPVRELDPSKISYATISNTQAKFSRPRFFRTWPRVSRGKVVQAVSQQSLDAEEKRRLEKFAADGPLPISLRTRLRELRRAFLKRKHEDDGKCSYPIGADGNYLYAHLHTRDDIPRGVVRSTSVKQKKEKSFFFYDPRSQVLSLDALKEKVWYEPKKLFKQQRLGYFLDKLTKPKEVCVGILGQPGSKIKKFNEHCVVLAEAIMKAKVKLMAKDNPNFLDALQDYEYSSLPGQPNMDTEQGDSSSIKIERSGNVVIETPNVVPSTSKDVPKSSGFLNMSSATEQQTFSQITDRWLKHDDDIEWNTTQTQNYELKRFKLPYDFLRTNLSSPNVKPFTIHKYARFDMKIHISVNSNAFQCGQLQASFMYNSHLNSRNAEYDDIWSASQRRHVIINAGASNSAELDLPYWALTSAINLKNNSDERDQGASALTLGELSIRVLSPLSCTSTAYKAAHVKVMIRFENPEFRGLCDSDINSPFVGQPQMEELVNTTESVLNLTKRVMNMDNPLKPELASTVQPMASHGFSAVGGQNEILRSLRSDPLAQTPALVENDGMDSTLDKLLHTWSLVNTFSWANTKASGEVLFKVDSAPIWSKPSYTKMSVNGRDFYRLPIISVLSSMFAYWRGDIELRFDFVATQYHSGAVAIVTIPGGEGSESLSKGKNSAYQVFKLLETHQVLYRIPYYNNVPFSKTKHNLDRARDVAPPSRTIVYVFNPLIPMDNVPATINVNVYIRAASNFELAILKTPSLGLSFNKNILYPTATSAWVDPSWGAMFTAGSRWCDNRICFFYNETTDYFTQFINLLPKTVYVVPQETENIKIGDKNYNFKVECYKDSATLVPVTHMVKLEQYSWYPVALCFLDIKNARGYAADPTLEKAKLYGHKVIAQGPWAQIRPVDGGKVGSWRNITAEELARIPFVKAPPELEDWIEVGQPNGEDGTVILKSITLDKPAAKTSFGNKVFGERIDSLAEICKRWYRCGCGRVFGAPGGFTCLSQAPIVCKISTHPLRTFLASSSRDVDNRLRDGMISLCSSGFAGYRGSMRYRLIINGVNTDNISFTVVHKFDKRVNTDVPTVYVATEKPRTASDYFDTAYAAELQSTFVNNVLEFEVPFYNRGEYNSMYHCNASSIYVLDNYQMSGEIDIYCSGIKDKAAIGFDVFYSIGDDFAFSNFQGFPKMTFLDEIPAEPNVDPAGDILPRDGNDDEELIVVPGEPEPIPDPLSPICPDLPVPDPPIPPVCPVIYPKQEPLPLSKYLASADSNGVKCSVFDEGYYRFGTENALQKSLLVYQLNGEGLPILLPRGTIVDGFKMIRYSSPKKTDYVCYIQSYGNKYAVLTEYFMKDNKLISAVGRIDNLNGFVIYGFEEEVVSPERGFDYDALLEAINEDVARPNMDYIKSFFTVPKKLGDTCDVIKGSVGSLGDKVVSAISSVISTTKNLASNVFSKIPSFSSLLESCGGFAHMLLTQILHILAKPFCKVTIAIAIFSILCASLSDKITTCFVMIKDSLTACWNWLFGKNKQNESDMKATPNLGEDDEEKATFLSLLWSMVATIAGYIGKGPRNLKEFAVGLFTKSSDTFRTHVFGVKFFKDFLVLLKRMWGWINTKLGFQKPLYKLTSNDRFLQEWALSSAVVLAPENRDLVITSKEWVSKLFEVQIVGRLIKQAAINTSKHITRDLLNMICDTQKRLTERVDELIKRKCYIPIRQEPFIVWFVGEPGVGKTHLCQYYMRRLAADYKLSPDIFSLVAGQKYYDLLQYQKFVLLDDFLNWTGDSAEEVFGQYLQMSGTNMLSLPRAVAQDKAVLDNFEFLFVTSNSMWFDLTCGIKCPEAYNRRRHLTIGVRLTSSFSKGYTSPAAAAAAYRKLPDLDKDRCQHLIFDIYEGDDRDPKSSVSSLDDLYVILKSYADKQRENASIKYFKMVREHMEALDKSANDVSSFTEFFDKMKRLCESAPEGDVLKGIDEAGKDCVVWISERLKARYSIYEEQVNSNLPNVEEAKKALDSAKASTSAQPNGPEDEIEVVGTDFDSALNGILEIANDASTYYEKQKSRFIDPSVGVYSIPDLPPLHCENHPAHGPMNGVFSYPQTCPHKNVRIYDCYFLQFSEQFRELVKTTYKCNPSPEGIFVNISQLGAIGEACFSTPCTLVDGSVDPCCHWANKLDYEEDLVRYWNTLAGVLHFKLPKWTDFVLLGDEKLKTFMPTNLLKKIKSIYDVDSKFIVKSNKSSFVNALFTVKHGFLADKLVIDGVNHGVYPTAREVKNEVRDGEEKVISRSKGLLYDDVEYYKSGDVKHRSEPSTLCKILITVGIVIAAISGLISFIDLILYFLEYWGVFSFWEWNKSKAEPQMSTSGDFKVSKQASKGTIKAIKLLQGTGNVDSLGDLEDGRLKKIINNVFWLVCKRKTGKLINGEPEIRVVKARCLGLFGYTAIALTHYLELFSMLKETQPDCTFSIIRKDTKTEEPYYPDKMIVSYPSEGGYCTIEFPKGGLQFKDIRKFIPNEGPIKYSSKATLVEVGIDDIVKTNLDIKLTFRKQLIEATPGSGMSSWEMTRKFEYAGKAGVGMCGSFLYDANSSKPLIGIHTSGLENKIGFSEVLLRETFQSANDTDIVEFVVPNLSLEAEEFQPSGPHVSIGHVSKDMGVIIPNKTRIIKSEAYGIFPTHTEPAPLHPSDPRLPPDSSPLALGIEKRCDLVKPFNSIDILKAKEDLENLILTQCKPVRALTNPLTYKQAVEGIEGIRGMEPLELKTSEGYPWVKMRPKGASDKRWLFKMKEDAEYPECLGFNKDLMETLNMKDQMRVRGVVPATYFTACLKDARILKSKVSVPGKTRLFEMSPIDMTLSQRKFFLDFNAAYMNSRRDCENTIGINVNSAEWSMLAIDLISFSEKILGGDYSSYGPKMSLEILHNVWDIMVAWNIKNMPLLTPDEIKNMKTMKYECLNSLLIVGRYVMRCLGGMHSGNVATVILNSLCNSMLIRIAFLGIMRKLCPKFASLVYFRKFVKMYSNGDDLIISVKDEIIDYFNNKTLMEFFQNYNLKYTNSKKDMEVVPFENIFEVSYLKCLFRPHPFREGEWLAALDMASIEDTPQWIWNRDIDPKEATILNCEQAVRLAYGHGPVEFNRIRDTIRSFFLANNIDHPLPTWSELDDNVWNEQIVIVYF